MPAFGFRKYCHIFKKALGVDLETPFPRLSYDDAMNRYGSDKPDLRFGLELQGFSQFVPASEFNVFKLVLESGGAVKALVAPGCAHFSRKKISELEETAKIYGAKGLAWMKVGAEGLDGGVSRFFADQHTLDRYKTAFYEPMLSDWRPYDAWFETGQKTATERAHEIVNQLLDNFQAPVMDPAIREELDSYIARRKEILA